MWRFLQSVSANLDERISVASFQQQRGGRRATAFSAGDGDVMRIGGAAPEARLQCCATVPALESPWKCKQQQAMAMAGAVLPRLNGGGNVACKLASLHSCKALGLHP